MPPAAPAAPAAPASVRAWLLARRGLVFVDGRGAQDEKRLRALELELGELGYVISHRLRARLALCSDDELIGFHRFALRVLAAHVGGHVAHEPLFRSFPDGIPDDTAEHWWNKVLVHFLQAEAAPCLFCRRVGTTHVLDPCRHVVCDRCFDGASYSACPVCEKHVDRGSPFFREAPARGPAKSRKKLTLLDLGDDLEATTRAVFVSFCERTRALSHDDVAALEVVLNELRARVLAWVPAKIPVRENVALVFATLFRACGPDEVLPHARAHWRTATDVLRFLAVFSGQGAALQGETRALICYHERDRKRFHGAFARKLKASKTPLPIELHTHRFPVAKLSRALRRTLLAVMEGFEESTLIEDMLRHRSTWVWMGEHLHPHEYAARFPKVARAFAVVRKKSPDGVAAPEFQGFQAKVERARRDGDVEGMVQLLATRPGELARRLDHALRSAKDEATRARVAEVFVEKLPALATPLLVGLRNHLPRRDARAKIRVYWPKGRVAAGFSAPDLRPRLDASVTAPLTRAIEDELLRRFAERPHFEDALLDEALADIVVPFNERTAAPSAVTLPRGSQVPTPLGRILRLFLHWCEPENGRDTDLDLSVAFYDAAWKYVGVCSYYQLTAESEDGRLVARSAGDLQDAPFPRGATELVDVHLDAARAVDVRWAVMVVNAYRGLPFSKLERAFAGLMARDDEQGVQFDPRAVHLRFGLAGENGVYVPLALDLERGVLHWLDVQARGQPELNNVETSKESIVKLCPELLTYFASGVRASMLDLALLHAAARCRRVSLRRGDGIAQYERRAAESVQEFHARLVRREPDEPRARAPREDGPPLFAALHTGNVTVPPGSAVYALFREQLSPTMAASDLLT